MTNIIVTAPGSLGDVNPLIAISRGLKAKGCEVTVATAERYLPLVERAGLGTRMLVSEREFGKVIGNPDLWHPRKGLKLVLQSMGVEQLIEHYQWLESEYVPGKTILVSHELDFAGRVFRDACPDSRLCTVLPGPVVLRSLTKPPQLTSHGVETKLPRFLLRGFYRFCDFMADRMLAPTINELRRRHGLPPVRRILDKWWYSPDLNLGLFDEWFAPPKSDWPAQLVCTGFPLADSGDLLPQRGQASSDAVLAPLRGQAPIIFAPGSAHAHASKFLAAGAEACRLLNRPGLLLSSVADQFPAILPSGVVTARYLPFSELLPRACAIVHHGGIGTTSQALAAGLPQVVCPMAFDQFDNASIIRRAGAGETVPMPRVTATKLASALRRVLESPDIAKTVKTLKGQTSNGRASPEYLADLVCKLA